MILIIGRKEVKIIRSAFLKILVILILLISITPLIQAKEIIVSAEAEIIAGVELARKEALQKAMVKAVRQEAGNFIRKSILVENYKLISSRIYSQAGGYISNYQILSESAAAGFYQVEIKADVTSKLFSDLEKLKSIIANQTNNPRLLLFVESVQKTALAGTNLNEFQLYVRAIEDSLTEQTGVSNISDQIQKNLRINLKELGFKLAKPSSQLEFMQSVGGLQGWEQNSSQLVSDFQFPFELLIIGKSELKQLGEKDFGFGLLKIAGVKSSFLVYSAQTGDQLKRITFTEKAYARSTQKALDLAIEKAGRAGAENLAQALLPLVDLNSGQKTLELKVNNLAAYQDLTKLEKVIKKLSGVQNFKLYSFADNSASYSLKVLQATDVLAERFANDKGFPLQVKKLGPDYLELRAN